MENKFAKIGIQNPLRPISLAILIVTALISGCGSPGKEDKAEGQVSEINNPFQRDSTSQLDTPEGETEGEDDSEGEIGHGAGTDTGQGFGSGSGRLGGTGPDQGLSSMHRRRELRKLKVIMGVDSLIEYPSKTSELRIWIGAYNPTGDNRHSIPADMKKDSTVIPALGQSATVIPVAPEFNFNPSETQCIQIHPSGSEVRFYLEPKRSGEFEVGADIFLYDSPDCKGTAVPKTAANLKVVVKVNRVAIVRAKAGEMGNVLWVKFMDFWGTLVALFFGLILFLIRRRLKKWFGFAEKK